MKKKLLLTSLLVVGVTILAKAFPPGTLEEIVKLHDKWGCCSAHDAVRALKIIFNW